MEKNKQEMAKEALKVLDEIEETVKLDRIVKDNKIVFQSEGKTYRIRKPNMIEQEEINKIQRKKYLEFVKDNDMLFRKQWLEIYKKKGIDIGKMELEMKHLYKEIKALLLRLVKVEDKKSLDKLKKEIYEKRNKQYIINIDKTDLLSHSIEDQLLIHVNSYVTYLVLEVKEKDNWIRVFNDYTTFRNSEKSDLLYKAFRYLNYLIYQHGLEKKNDKS